MYINRGRFGEFVKNLLESEYQRKKEEAEKDDDMKLWIMYVHNHTVSSLAGLPFNESFNEWKKRVCVPADAKQRKNSDAELTDDGIHSILTKLFPD